MADQMHYVDHHACVARMLDHFIRDLGDECRLYEIQKLKYPDVARWLEKRTEYLRHARGFLKTLRHSVARTPQSLHNFDQKRAQECTQLSSTSSTCTGAG